MTTTRRSFRFKAFSCLTTLFFLFTSIITPVQASTLNQLPIPGTMLTVSEAYTPVLMKGMTVNLQNPFQFDFIVHPGDSGLEGDAFKDEAQKLVKYFLAALTTPEDQLWVNLSPYEKNRIIPQYLGQTDMGYEMLAQDYILKQLTASLMYPEGDVGKKFWEEVYKKAAEQGITDVPMDTFNKVWIVPNKVTIYEHENHAFVVENSLKVMLEEDYMARDNAVIARSGSDEAISKNSSEIATPDNAGLAMTTMKDVVRSVIIPVIEKEVNEGKNFASLRQIYNGMLLAAWYKKRLKESVLGQVYADKNKVAGIDTVASSQTEAVWNRYVEAFQKGAYNYIGEDYNPDSGEMVSKKYFSGGVNLVLPGNAAFEKNIPPQLADLASLAGSYDLTTQLRNPDDDIMDINGPNTEQDHAMLIENAATVEALFDKIKDGVTLNLDGSVNVVDETIFRNQTIDYLIQEANYNPNPAVKTMAQKVIRKAANALGIKSGSNHDFYTARNEGKWDGLTTPAYNVRTGPAYDTMRQIIKSVNQQKVGPFVFELAASERRYTGQLFSEYTANGYAAAIKEGYKGFLFFRFDHLQLKKTEVIDDYKTAITKITKVMHEAVEAGVYLIDLDPSTVVDDRYLDKVLPIEFDVTTKHIQQRMEVDAAFKQKIEEAGGIQTEFAKFDKESPVVRDVRRSLINHLEVGNLPNYYENILKKVEDNREKFEEKGLTKDKYLQNGLLTSEDVGYLRQFPIDPTTLETLKQYYHNMHRMNYEITIGLLKYAREVLEPAYGLKAKSITLSMGIEVMHVDNPTHAKFPSTVLGALALMQQVNQWSDENGYARPSTLSLQSGTQHGLGGDAYWGIYVAHEAAREALGVGTFSQHGTSTIDLDRFWNMPYMGSGDAHLATEYQKIAFGIAARENYQMRSSMEAYMLALINSDWDQEELGRQIGSQEKAAKIVAKLQAEKLWDSQKRKKDYGKFLPIWNAIFESLTAKGWSDEDIVNGILADDIDKDAQGEKYTYVLDGKTKPILGALKDLTKELSAPFKTDFWALPIGVRTKIDERLLQEFTTIHRELNLTNTQNVLSDAGYDINKYQEPTDNPNLYWPEGTTGLGENWKPVSFASVVGQMENEAGGVVAGFFNTQEIEKLIANNTGEVVDQADEAMLQGKSRNSREKNYYEANFDGTNTIVVKKTKEGNAIAPFDDQSAGPVKATIAGNVVDKINEKAYADVVRYLDSVDVVSSDEADDAQLYVPEAALPVVAQTNGGLDFNSVSKDMQIQMGSDGFVFPKVDAAMLERFNVQGLQMNVIQFRPLGMPVLRQMIGLSPEPSEKDSDIGYQPDTKAVRQEIAGVL